MTARSLGALAILVAVGLAAPALAADPVAGAYGLTAATGGVGTGFDMFLVVLQTDSTVVVAVLDPLDSSWTFGSGTLNADQQVDGVLRFGDVLEAGRFLVRFQGATVTATITLYEFAVIYSGTKIF